MNASSALAICALALQGCALSTTYQPKPDGRVKLTMDTGRLALTKDGRTLHELEGFSALVTCDEEARTYAYAAEQNVRSGQTLMTTAMILNVLVAPSPIAVVLIIMGANDAAEGRSQMIDAMNRANDAESCGALARVEEVSR